MNLSGEDRNSESTLVQRARRGDEAAWESLVRIHQEPAFRLAFLLLGDSDQAEDVTQDAFLRAYRSLNRYDSSHPFRPWPLSITANLSRNQLRAVSRYLAALRRFSSGGSVENNGVEARASQNLQAQQLWQAVRQLSHDDQQIIYLRYFLDLPVVETADALEIAEGTVKSRLHRALNRLRVVIQREFPDLKEGMLDG